MDRFGPAFRAELVPLFEDLSREQALSPDSTDALESLKVVPASRMMVSPSLTYSNAAASITRFSCRRSRVRPRKDPLTAAFLGQR
jgi:hypothetical protein